MSLLDIKTIRRANLLLLLAECSDGRGAAAKLSRLTNVPQPYISQLKRDIPHSGGAQRGMGDDTARALETGMNKPPGWMDHDHSGTGPSDTTRRIEKIASSLTHAQQRLLLQMAEAFAEGNGKPPQDDGPAIREPRAPRRH